MGNYKFKLSDMIPNSWIFKLKDMTKSTSSKKKLSPPNFKSHSAANASRKSYYYNRDHANLPSVDPPRRSSKHRHAKNPKFKKKSSSSSSSSPPSPKLITSSVSSGCNCRANLRKPHHELRYDRVLVDHHKSSSMEFISCHCRSEESFSPNNDDIVTDVDEKSITKLGYELPPIITKSTELKTIKAKEPARKSTSSPGVKLRVNSPRIASRRYQVQNQGRKSSSSKSRQRRSVSAVTDSFAVVKSSYDLQRDFRESIVEMIVQNNIRASKDLEDLLACYLSLNSDEYHDLIINVFKQIWFDLTDMISGSIK